VRFSPSTRRDGTTSGDFRKFGLVIREASIDSDEAPGGGMAFPDARRAWRLAFPRREA